MIFEVDPAATLFMSIFFVALGSTSACLNTVNIFTYSNHKLRLKYMYQLSMEVFELFDSIAYILTGIGRGSALLGGYMGAITVHDCFYKTYWVHALILGIELPCGMVILMSIEKIYAATRPALYQHIFETTRKVKFVGVVVLIGFISLSVAAYSAYGDRTENNSRHCAIISATSFEYATFHFTFIIFSYTISFASLVCVYFLTNNVTGSSTQHDREKKLMIMIIVTGTSVGLVSTPSVVMLGIRLNVWVLSDWIVAVAYGMPGMLTIANTIINVYFRADYREVLLANFRFRVGMTIWMNATVKTQTVMYQHAFYKSRVDLPLFNIKSGHEMEKSIGAKHLLISVHNSEK